MADLRKWFSHKFNRNKNQERNGADDESVPVARRTSWDDPLARIERDMGQMFRSLLGGGDDRFLPHMSAARAPNWFGDYSPRRFSPSVDVTNESHHLVVSAELPGMDRDDVEVTFHDGTLVIQGEKRHTLQKEEDGCFRTERFFGSFRRAIPIPADVDPDGAEATFDHGVLTVKFPKVEMESANPRRIQLR